MKFLTFILLIFLSACKEHSKPLVLQENKSLDTIIAYNNTLQCRLNKLHNNNDSATYYLHLQMAAFIKQQDAFFKFVCTRKLKDGKLEEKWSDSVQYYYNKVQSFAVK